MAREITEVWGVFNADGDLLGLGEIRTEAILASDFGCDDDTQDALYEGSNGPHNGVTVERLPLLSPHDAAVLEAAGAYEKAHTEFMAYNLVDPNHPDTRALQINARAARLTLVKAVRARRAANAGGECAK
ncbi:MAG: hypothetical protein ACK5X3_00670 [Pseudomonadota bacterium]|jgi:hypothetical protein